jgi:hypothetical protein
VTITGGSIVDAAHIHQFADSRNNDPSNGLALCKNAHWLFDQGLWTISDDYRVIVAIGQFTEQSLGHTGLCNYHGQRIHLPADIRFWPKSVYLSWHRKNVFQGKQRNFSEIDGFRTWPEIFLTSRGLRLWDLSADRTGQLSGAARIREARLHSCEKP